MNRIEEPLVLRIAEPDDAEALSFIYKPYVEQTAVSFEYEAPDEDEFKRRIADKLNNYPFIVAVYRGEVVGYTYASAFLPRPAYQHSVETSLYVRTDFRGNKIGSSLYNMLEKILKRQNVLSLNACIAYTEQPDPFLDNASVLFHRKMGFRQAGRFCASGYKFDRFYDIVWMEKHISEPITPFDSFIPFKVIRPEAEALLSGFR